MITESVEQPRIHRDLVDKLVGLFATRPFGTAVPHQCISVLIGKDYPSVDYYQIVNRAIAEARRQHGRCVDSIPRHGYVVLHPHEHRRHAAKYVRQGRHKFVVAQEVLSATTYASKCEGRLVSKSASMLRNLSDVATIVSDQLRREKGTAIAKEIAQVQGQIDALLPSKSNPEVATKLAALIRLRGELKRLRP